MTNTIQNFLSHPVVSTTKNGENGISGAFPTYFHLHYDTEIKAFLLNMIGSKEADYAYIIKDVQGKIFQKGEISTSLYDFQVIIPAPDIKKGIYSFRLEAYDGSQTYLSRLFVNESDFSA